MRAPAATAAPRLASAPAPDHSGGTPSLGLLLQWDSSQSFPEVVAVTNGSPAHGAGLLCGDIVEYIDDVPVTNIGRERLPSVLLQKSESRGSVLITLDIRRPSAKEPTNLMKKIVRLVPYRPKFKRQLPLFSR